MLCPWKGVELELPTFHKRLVDLRWPFLASIDKVWADNNFGLDSEMTCLRLERRSSICSSPVSRNRWSISGPRTDILTMSRLPVLTLLEAQDLPQVAADKLSGPPRTECSDVA